VKVEKRIFLRDISAYLIALAVIVITAIDGKMYIYESSFFLIIYLCYVLLVVFLERRLKIQNEGSKASLLDAPGTLTGKSRSDQATIDPITGQPMKSPDSPREKSPREKSIQDPVPLVTIEGLTEIEHPPEYIVGISWPAHEDLRHKVQLVVEYPFSILRWISSPPADGLWSKERRIFAVIMPTFLGFILLIMTEGWDGFTMQMGDLPVPAFITVVGTAFSVILFATTNNKEKPPYYNFLVFLSFVSSIAWLNIIANECVAILQTIGIVWDVSSALLGLTVLAIGNSVGDFAADTAVARAGEPECGVASCFGSPLLNDVVGLGIALTVTCAGKFPDPFTFSLNTQVYLGWTYLGVSLVSSLIVFPLSWYAPPRLYGWYLIILYFVFLCSTIILQTVIF